MPLFWLSLAFLLGLWLARGLPGLPGLWLVVLALALFWLVASRLRFARRVMAGWQGLRSRFPAWPAGWRLPYYPLSYAWLLVALGLGAWRGLPVPLPSGPAALNSYNDLSYPLVLEGVLVQPPDTRDRTTYLRVQIDQLHPVAQPLFQPVNGLLLAQVPPGGDWRYGDRVRLQGWLKSPPVQGDFSFRDYLARQEVYSFFTCAVADETCAWRLSRDQGSWLLAGIFALRERALNQLYRLFPDPEAALIAGILLGVENRIPGDVQQAFRDTGTAHIVATSGFNITLLSGLFSYIFLRLLGRRRRFLAAGLSALAIAVYTILVGAYAAVVRAAILGGLAVFARQLGRRQHGFNSLAFAAALMAWFDPDVLWDVSFQLSFSATLGLVLYAAPLEQAAIQAVGRLAPAQVARQAGRLLGEYLLFTLAAQLTTLPVVWYHFQRLSVIALLANPLVLPVQPLLMFSGGAALLASFVVFPVGQALAFVCWPTAAYTIRLAELLAQAPLAAVTVERPAPLWIGLFYALLLTWTFLGGRSQPPAAQPGANRPGRSWAAFLPAAALLLMGGAVFLTWQALLLRPDGRLYLTVLDVGNGEALLVQTPGGRTLLLDGGPAISPLSQALGRRLPLLQRKIDFLVVAAVGEEQIGALPPLIERLPVGSVLWAGSPLGSYSARELQKQLAAASIPVLSAQPGQALELGAGARLEVLALAGRGAVYRLRWERFSALLPLGLNFSSQEALIENPQLGPVTALLLADSGLASLNTAAWIARWQPRLLLLSVAAGDSEGRPEAELLEATRPYPLLRTDRNGWIRLGTDGQQLWVEVERR